MSDQNQDSIEIQTKIADKLSFAASRILAIESMEEQIKETVDDLVYIFKECNNRKSKADVQLMLKVYTDANKVRRDEQEKVTKHKANLQKVEEFLDTLSVYKNMSTVDIEEVADSLLGKPV